MFLYEKNFDLQKKKALESLNEALEKGLVDSDIIFLLNKINSLENYFTTSSCSGRISVMQLPDFGDKLNAVWLGKWHSEVKIEEVLDAINKHDEGMLWFMLNSPILHIAARTLEDAVELLNLAISCGFKHSNIKSISHKKLVVEIRSTERMDVPLGKDKELWVSPEHLAKIISMANLQLRRAKEKLKRFENEIEKLKK